MDLTEPSHYQTADLFTRADEIDLSQQQTAASIKEAGDLAFPVLRYLVALNAVARARRLVRQSARSRKAARRNRSWGGNA